MLRADEDAIHVLHVVPGLGAGGMELAMSRVVERLSARGMRHSIVCLKGEPEIRDRFSESVPIHCLHAGSNDPGLPYRLWRLIRDVRPSVIHARNWSAWPDVALARLGMWPRAPLIFSFHGFAETGPMPWRRRMVLRLIPKMTTKLFTVSESSRRMLARDFGWPQDRVAVIPNGVDTVRFSPACAPRLDGQRLIVGAVGNLTPVKNHALLVRALAELVHQGADVELRIAGSGPERERLLDLAQAMGVSDRTRLVGQMADVPGFLHNIDVFVLPSTSEAHPNVLLEAMACGLPCVATDVGGVSEVLDEGRVGHLVQPGNQAALAGAIAELAADRDLRRHRGARARQRACDQYSLDRMIDAYDQLYRDLSCERSHRAVGVGDPRSDTAQRRVLMLAPLPPLRGGMATVADNLRRSHLADRCRLTTLNNGKMTAEGRSFLAGAWAQVRLLGRVLGTVRRMRARIVHIHTCALFSFWRDSLHMLALRAMGRRVIYHIHDGTFEAFLRDQPPVRKAILRRSLRMASRVILLSEMARASLEPLAPKVAWRVVHNGVAIPPTTGGSRGGTVRFLFLGNLTRRKGAYDLLAATVRAQKAGLKAEVRLAGGEVQPGDRRALEQAIADTGCKDQVKVLGYLEGPARDEALRTSDCLVLPSYAEGLPMVVLEAMACGLPVIATRIGAVPEAVTDGQEGFLIDVGDVEALADRMLRIAADADLRRRMGAAARRRAEAEFSLDTMADRMLAIYGEALSK